METLALGQFLMAKHLKPRLPKTFAVGNSVSLNFSESRYQPVVDVNDHSRGTNVLHASLRHWRQWVHKT